MCVFDKWPTLSMCVCSMSGPVVGRDTLGVGHGMGVVLVGKVVCTGCGETVWSGCRERDVRVKNEYTSTARWK